MSNTSSPEVTPPSSPPPPNYVHGPMFSSKFPAVHQPQKMNLAVVHLFVSHICQEPTTPTKIRSTIEIIQSATIFDLQTFMDFILQIGEMYGQEKKYKVASSFFLWLAVQKHTLPPTLKIHPHLLKSFEKDFKKVFCHFVNDPWFTKLLVNRTKVMLVDCLVQGLGSNNLLGEKEGIGLPFFENVFKMFEITTYKEYFILWKFIEYFYQRI